MTMVRSAADVTSAQTGYYRIGNENKWDLQIFLSRQEIFLAYFLQGLYKKFEYDNWVLISIFKLIKYL